jgi:predicted nucleic acid-binding protein
MMAGRSPDLAMDGLLAATADVHGLTVVSRNVRHFQALGVAVLDPFEPAA